MPSINISGLDEREIEQIDSLVEKSGASSRSEFLRWRLRAGVRIYDAGEFDPEALDKLTVEDGGRT